MNFLLKDVRKDDYLYKHVNIRRCFSLFKKPKTRAFRAALLSTLWMGLGQIYNRQWLKGILYASFELILLAYFRKPFLHAMWGLWTLGETPQQRVGGKVVFEGDHSIFLMIEGLIAILLFLIVLAVYIYNIKDAYDYGRVRAQDKTVIEGNIIYKALKAKSYPYILLIPASLFIVFLVILPLIFGILIAFTNYSSPYHLPPKSLVDWVGFKNFINIVKLEAWSQTFWGILVWNIIWALIATFSTYFIGLFYAVLINSKRVHLKRLWRTIFILPWAIPYFVSILIFRNILNMQFGPLNQILVSIGLTRIPWLVDPFWAKVSIVIVNIWLGFPYWMALLSGMLGAIDKEIYEAAEIDGARAWQQFCYLTVPMLLFSTSPLIIMSIASNFNNFNLIYLLTGGGPANPNYMFAGSTDIIISWIYKLTLEQGQYHMASVMSILIFIFIATISIINFRRTKTFKEEDIL